MGVGAALNEALTSLRGSIGDGVDGFAGEGGLTEGGGGSFRRSGGSFRRVVVLRRFWGRKGERRGLRSLFDLVERAIAVAVGALAGDRGRGLNSPLRRATDGSTRRCVCVGDSSRTQAARL